MKNLLLIFLIAIVGAGCASTHEVSILYNGAELEVIDLQGKQLTHVWHTLKPLGEPAMLKASFDSYDKHEFKTTLSRQETFAFREWASAHDISSFKPNYPPQRGVARYCRSLMVSHGSLTNKTSWSGQSNKNEVKAVWAAVSSLKSICSQVRKGRMTSSK